MGLFPALLLAIMLAASVALTGVADAQPLHHRAVQVRAHQPQLVRQRLGAVAGLDRLGRALRRLRRAA